MKKRYLCTNLTIRFTGPVIVIKISLPTTLQLDETRYKIYRLANPFFRIRFNRTREMCSNRRRFILTECFELLISKINCSQLIYDLILFLNTKRRLTAKG